MNTFINFVKKSLIRGETKSGIRTLGEIGALKIVKALLLLIFNFFAEP